MNDCNCIAALGYFFHRCYGKGPIRCPSGGRGSGRYDGADDGNDVALGKSDELGDNDGNKVKLGT